MGDGREVNVGAQAPVTVAGTDLRLLTGGRERLDALIRLVDEAKESLRLLYYIYSDDGAGRRLRDALKAALDRGVEVRLIVDGFGSGLPDDYFAVLRENGADICRFLPRYGRRYLLRNHQKLALADGVRAIIGGFNIEDSYFDERTGWRDLGLLMDGPAVEHLVGYFDALMHWTHQPHARIRTLRKTLADWSQSGDGAVRWLFGGPTRRLSPWAATIKADMEGARALDMIASYFAPGPRMMRRIEGVARHGRARIITPSKVDHAAAIAAARHTYKRLLRRGVRIFEYQPMKLHTKLFVIDDIVHLGSANFDMRSMFINLEMMVRIKDATFAAAIRRYFEEELADSREIAVAEHAKAGMLDRLRWAAAYFVMAVVDVSVTRRLNFGIEDPDAE